MKILPDHPSINQPRREIPALLAAAANNDVSRVRKLLRHGADANQTNHRGKTALHLAAAARDVDGATASPFEVVDLLIKQGADVNALDNKCNTPLYLAIPRLQRPAHADVIELLLKSGAQIDLTLNADKSPLYQAVLLDRPRILGALFQHNIHASVDSTSPTTQRTSPIHCAAHNGRAECLRILVENGFDPNLQIDADTMTPVHTAIRTAGHGHIFAGVLDRCMKTLHAMLKVNVNFELSCYGQDFSGGLHYNGKFDAKKTTPFEYALHFDRFDIANFLADIGVNIQSIRHICRKRKIKALPLEDEQIAERQPGESADRFELLSLLRKAASPWSLCSLCRSVVRREMGMRIQDINVLDIPATLKDYVMFSCDYGS